MKNTIVKKVLSLLIVFTFIFQQAGFAQGIGQLEISKYINQLNTFSGPEKFRPLHLRYFSYNPLTDNFKILLDKGDLKKIEDGQIEAQGQELLKYFLIGIALPDTNFWVNLRPDSEDKIIDRELAKTDLGKVLLEADLQLKKDVASFTSPQTAEGKAYWNALYKKAGQIFGSENITIPTLTRPWIVPGEVIIREDANSAYIYKATLKVMLEQDHLKNSSDYNFTDPRLKELNEYSSKLIREKIIPKLTKEVNSTAKYASLRQAYYSLILARWFKTRFAGKSGLYSNLINTGDLAGLTSQGNWSKTTYFKEYQKSFSNGEYNIKEQVNAISGPAIRTYFSGGIALRGGELRIPTQANTSSPLGIFKGSSPVVAMALGNSMVPFAGAPIPGQIVPDLKTNIVVTASSPLQIRTEFTVPEGQKKGFFTNDHQSYRIGELFKAPVREIPHSVVKTVQSKLDQYVKEGKLLSAVVNDFGGTDIDIHVTHRYGELNASVQRLLLEAMRLGCFNAQQLGLLKPDISTWNLADFAKAMRVKQREHSITERGSEPVVVAKLIGAGIGASNIILFHQFFMPGSTPLVKLGFTPYKGKDDKAIVRGFRAVVRRIGDVFEGKTDGDVYEFEFSSEATVDGVHYNSVNQAQELLALASQPNDYVITEIYAVEGSVISSTEPVVSVEYQSVYGEKGNTRTLNPTFIFRSQSGADAVGGVASMFYHSNFVPGGPNGERYVTIKPVTLAEARIAPEEGIANVVVYGWQSEGDGRIARVVDHVGLNPPALSYIRSLAKWLAGVMKTHPDDQPYVAPFAAEARVEKIREEQTHLFEHAPKEADIDPVMAKVEEQVASGKLVSVTDDKADMGGDDGHNYVPDYMSAVYRATLIQASKHGKLIDGNIVGFMDRGRLKIGKTPQIGDDGHQLMIGDKTHNSAEAHQLSFLAFTRAYLIAVASGKKPYGLAQDYQGKEAKAAKKNPYFYSKLDQEFLDILREVMPKEYLYMVDNVEKGWKEWEISKESVTLPEPFSGNVSQQGIGSARFLMNFEDGERAFGILAGDKMGPAGINRPIREGVYAALKAGEFGNGLVFEIWDAKAYDEHGNIPVEKLPVQYADIQDYVAQLIEKANKSKDPTVIEEAKAAYDDVKNSYDDNGDLKTNLDQAQKQRLANALKKAGFVPTERIFLDAEEDKEAIYIYLADSDRFNIKQVWSKKASGWDINYFQPYLDKPILGSSVTKLGILAGGEYVGKDDPVMVGSLKLMEHIWKFLEDNPTLLQGDMNGSHWLAGIPTKFKYAVANVDSHPIFVGLRYTVDDQGKIIDIKDVFSNRSFDKIRNKMFKFNFLFKWIASLGGQFAPYGTDVRTVEASYPLAKFLRQLQDPKSPFLIRNMPEESRRTRPIGIFAERRELFEVATKLPEEAIGSPVSSPVQAQDVSDSVGGIDFRMIPMVTQPMGNFSGLNLNLPRLSNVQNINLTKELSQMQEMVKAGIVPSGERLKEYVAACYQKGELKQQTNKLVAFMTDICKLEEEKVAGASNELKEVMLILDSVS